MSTNKPTQPAPSPFHHTVRAANAAMLVDLYRSAARAVLTVNVTEKAPHHVRMDVITQELVRRHLGELASDLNDEWMAQACLDRMTSREPVVAVLASELAKIRIRIRGHIRAAGAR